MLYLIAYDLFDSDSGAHDNLSQAMCCEFDRIIYVAETTWLVDDGQDIDSIHERLVDILGDEENEIVCGSYDVVVVEVTDIMVSPKELAEETDEWLRESDSSKVRALAKLSERLDLMD